MDTFTLMVLVLGLVLSIAVVIGFATLVVWLIKGILKGGWQVLASRYAVDQAPPDEVSHHLTVKIGAIVYKNCVSLAIEPGGLFLAKGKSKLLIPWEQLQWTTPVMLYWQKWPTFSVGQPVVTRLSIPPSFADAAAHRMAEPQECRTSSG